MGSPDPVGPYFCGECASQLDLSTWSCCCVCVHVESLVPRNSCCALRLWVEDSNAHARSWRRFINSSLLIIYKWHKAAHNDWISVLSLLMTSTLSILWHKPDPNRQVIKASPAPSQRVVLYRTCPVRTWSMDEFELNSECNGSGHFPEWWWSSQVDNSWSVSEYPVIYETSWCYICFSSRGLGARICGILRSTQTVWFTHEFWHRKRSAVKVRPPCVGPMRW